MALHVTMEVPAERSAIEAAVEGLASLNYNLMRSSHVSGDGYPPLYASGIVYRREVPGREDWQSADRLLAGGEGDCEDLAAYRTAELRLAGEPARVAIVPTRGGTMYHAVVRRANGEIEDPSRILIGQEADREEGSKMRPKVTIKNMGSHYLGAIDMPMNGGGHVRVQQLGWSPWGAIKKAAHAAASIAQNPAFQSIMPPQVVMAIKTAQQISRLSRGALRKLQKHPQASPAQRRMATALLRAPVESEARDAQDEDEVAPAAAPARAPARPIPVRATRPTVVREREEYDEEEYDDEVDEEEEEEEEEFEEELSTEILQEQRAQKLAENIWGVGAFAEGA